MASRGTRPWEANTESDGRMKSLQLISAPKGLKVAIRCGTRQEEFPVIRIAVMETIDDQGKSKFYTTGAYLKYEGVEFVNNEDKNFVAYIINDLLWNIYSLLPLGYSHRLTVKDSLE